MKSSPVESNISISSACRALHRIQLHININFCTNRQIYIQLTTVNKLQISSLIYYGVIIFNRNKNKTTFCWEEAKKHKWFLITSWLQNLEHGIINRDSTVIIIEINALLFHSQNMENVYFKLLKKWFLNIYTLFFGPR